MKKIVSANERKQRGLTLLEYVAGAAVVIGLVYAAMVAMGGDIGDLMSSIGNWAGRRSAQIDGQ